jgi:hypothetical protein
VACGGVPRGGADCCYAACHSRKRIPRPQRSDKVKKEHKLHVLQFKENAILYVLSQLGNVIILKRLENKIKATPRKGKILRIGLCNTAE